MNKMEHARNTWLKGINDKNNRNKQKMTNHRNEYMYMNDRYIYEYMNEQKLT